MILYIVFALTFVGYAYTAIRSSFIFIELRNNIPFNEQWQGNFSKKSLLALKNMSPSKDVKRKVDIILLYSSISKWCVYGGFLLMVILMLFFG